MTSSNAASLALTSTDNVLPEFLEVGHIVRASSGSFTERTVRAHIKRLGITEKVGGKLFIPRAKLRSEWPSVYEVLVRKALEGRELAAAAAA